MKNIFIVMFILIASTAQAQQPFKKQDLIGAWSYVTSYSQFPDGRKENQFSDKPRGIFIILPNGLYSHIIMADDLPRVRSGRFKESTIEEAEKIAEGALAHFGTYEVDETAGTFTVKIIKSSFPNFDGAVQKRTVIELTANTLSYINDLSVAAPGAIVVAVLRRVW